MVDAASGQPNKVSASLSNRQVIEPVALLLVAITTIIVLQSTRVLLSYAMFGIEQRSQLFLIVMTVMAFPATGLVWLINKGVGPRRTVLIAASVLAASRLVMQFWTEPEPRIVTGSIAIASSGWLMLKLLNTRRDAAALGVVLGLAIDFAIRTAFRTVDLPWMPGPAANIVTGIIVAVLLWLAWNVRVDTPARAATAVTLFAVGPGLALYHLVIGSSGLVQVNADLDYPVAASLLAAGLALGVVGSSLLFRERDSTAFGGRSGYLLTGGVSLAGAGGLWLAWRAEDLAPIGFAVVTAISSVMLATSVIGRPPVGYNRGIGATTLWFTAGIGVQAVLLLIYFVASNVALAIVLAYGFVAVCAIATAGANDDTHALAGSKGSHLAVSLVVCVLLLMPAIWQWIRWDPPEPGEPLRGDVTVMTFNIQTGFTADDDFDLEAIAQTIENGNPDIVVLQEVARGWPFTTGIDQAVWLSERLDMPYVFGQSDSLRLWSVAILSRAPMTDVLRYQFSVLDFERGAVAALIEAEGEDLWVFGTHLAAPGSADEVRALESLRLLDAWGEREPAVIAGDFNATPESMAMQAFREAGLVDLGIATGSTAATFHDGRRIDHILVTQGIEIVRVAVPQSNASDHRPIVAVIRLPESE